MRKTDNEILKKTLLHYINLEYYANGLDEEFQTLLNELQERCTSAIKSQKSINTKTEYSILYKLIKEEVDKFKKELEERLEEQAEIIMNQELEFLDDVYNQKPESEKKEKSSTLAKAALALSGVSLAKILFSPIDGRDTVKQFAERTGKNILRAYDTPLRAGYLFGQKSEDVNTQITNQMKQVARGMQSGIRTAIPSFAKTTDRIVFLTNNVEVVWVATLDGRTCIKCASLSGLHFKSVSEAPSVPQHCLCRCQLLPVNSITEPIPTYQEFIESLNEDEQKQVLGANRYEMWKKYDISLDKFINNGSVISVKDLKNKFNSFKNPIAKLSKISVNKDLIITTNNNREIYKSPKGGIIIANYGNSTEEELRNITALKPFADDGKNATLLFAINHEKVRTPDALIDGIEWEIKTITNKTQNIKSAIDSAIKKAHTQANRVILNFEIEVNEKHIKAFIENRVHQHKNIQEIAIEFNGENKQQYSRKEILDWYNDDEVKAIIDNLKHRKS